ncbi:NADH-quinone oxidoreductase subunit C [Streptomyces sp. NPDC048521]|uniref:NADH-quinone oxidoreductase subunit C n=1 Tax=Streptomyces sp. NPDC048521 TaxID=3365566 RepID=UPI0037206E1C
MSTVGWLPAPAEELFGTDATAEESYDVLTVDVPPSSWLTALETARTTLSCTYFDWLSAVDEPGTGFRVSAHVVALDPVRRLLVRTTVPHEAPTLPSAVGVYAGAAWHERETHEMFGVVFDNHPGLEHLLLPENFEGHPLRKDFVLAARVAKAWPGAKEPGEPAAGAAHGGPKRRQMLPPGVPDPNEWGPLKGQLPPAPARPARTAGRAAGERPARAAGERPVRRTRTTAQGSASQTGATTAEGVAGAQPGEGVTSGAADSQTAPAGSGAGGTQPGAAGARTGAGAGAPGRPRRMRSASEGSVSQAAAAPEDTTARAEDAAAPADDTAARAVKAPAPAEDAAAQKQAAAEGDAAQAAAVEGPAAEASVAHEPGPTQPAAPTPAPVRPRRARTASEGSASQRAGTPEAAPAPAEPTEPVKPGSAEPTEPAPAEPDDAVRPARRSTAPRSSDAPWHHARPAFDEPEPEPTPRSHPKEPARSGATPEEAAESVVTPEEPTQPREIEQPSETAEQPRRPGTPAEPAADGTPAEPDQPDHPAGGPQ